MKYERPRYRVPAGRRVVAAAKALPTPGVSVVVLPPVNMPAARPPRPHRFKVQQRVEFTARDHADKPYLLGEAWRTVVEADKQTTAERQLLHKIAEHPHREYRIAEEWPIGSNLRVLK